MEQKHRDRLRHLWEADIKSVQKLVKITGQGRSTIYKSIKKLKQGDDLKRAPGSGRKRMLKGNDLSRVSQIAVKNYFQVLRSPRESRSKDHRRSVAGQAGAPSVTLATSNGCQMVIVGLYQVTH